MRDIAGGTIIVRDGFGAVCSKRCLAWGASGLAATGSRGSDQPSLLALRPQLVVSTYNSLPICGKFAWNSRRGTGVYLPPVAR